MVNKNRFVLIMAGGVGSRFWPASRSNMPKQFLDILGLGKSLLQLSYQRALKLVPGENILIATNQEYLELVSEQLPDLPTENILLEPSRNNTAPCIAYAAFKIDKIHSEAVFAVLPSDHIMENEDEFVASMNRAFDFASNENALLTLGVLPTRPDTGYGYIKKGEEIRDGVFKVSSFEEKPDLSTAEEYLQSGQYLWNAGIFVWSNKSILSAFVNHAFEIHKILISGKDYFNTEQERSFINEHYPNTPNISIDYAILEKSQNVFTIPVDFGWTDLGTWNSLHVYLPKDEKGNVILSTDNYISNSNNNLIKSKEGKVIVIDGLEDYIIVDEEDALLIYPKSKEQEIKSIRNQLDKKYL